MDKNDITADFITALGDPVRDIARDAGTAIMDIVKRGFEVTAKDDRTPVTDADHAAEAVILPGLARLTPDIPVISEEAASRGEDPSVTGDTFWLVDPLDGTREFIEGGKEFAVCLGLIAGGRPAFGLIHGPALGLTYWTAAPDTVLRANDAGKAVEVSARNPPAAGLTVITSRFHNPKGRLVAYLRTLPMAEHVLMSSALKFGRLAEGAADFYPRFGPTSEWDTGAGHAILEAAGGSVTTEDGNVLGYGKENYLNPNFFARGRP